MKMPTAHIWKTAIEAGRERTHLSDRNLHIGKTMRDLYTGGEVQSTKLQSLLEELRKREAAAKKK